ncbi:MAG: class I SAM-dependent methyltransferase [Eggerthellales bacterium]|nr:class I SAM-dependent methyltransferase [Eggerthellales bacterium]
MGVTANSASLLTTDWAEEWKQLQVLRQRSDDASYWDGRAKNFGHNDRPNDYANSFIELANLQEGESVFDMGCGNGALALPLARAGHPVLACDFSGGMLERLRADAEAQGLTNITSKQMSWADDWEAAGVLPKSCDVAIASRSIVTSDLRDSLERLSSVARRKCCITLSTGHSPRSDENILRAIGMTEAVGRDYWYALNILIQMGIKPELQYIKSARHDIYESFDEAYGNASLMLEGMGELVTPQRKQQLAQNLHAWVTEHLKPCESGFMFDEPRVVSWAFISWDA